MAGPTIRSWEPERVLAAAMDELEARMHAVGAAGADEMRTRAPTRTERLRAQLGYRLERGHRHVTAWIGVMDRSPRRAFWWLWQEFGAAHHEAQPFMRQAIFGSRGRLIAAFRRGRRA